MADTKRNGNAPTGDFAAFLASNRPKTSRELGDRLRDLVRAVQDTGKAGSITLTMTVEPVKDEISIVAINDKVKVALPEHKRMGSLAYPDRDGNLSRSDPNQMPLFNEDDIRDAPNADARTGEIKDIDNR